MLLGGVPGVAPAQVTVICGGVVGAGAIRMAVGMGAHVTVLDRDIFGCALDIEYGPRLTTLFATRDAIEAQVLESDLVVGRC